jgi:hypothetical protein
MVVKIVANSSPRLRSCQASRNFGPMVGGPGFLPSGTLAGFVTAFAMLRVQRRAAFRLFFAVDLVARGLLRTERRIAVPRRHAHAERDAKDQRHYRESQAHR